MISKKFISSSFIYAVIGSLPMASAFILLLFFTNHLSTNDYGLLAIYYSITLLVQIVVNFAMDTSIGVHYFEFRDDPAKLRKYIGTIAGSLIMIGIVFTLLSLMGGNFLFSKIFPANDIKFYPYGFISILTGIFNSLFKTYTNLLINQGRPGRYFWSNITTFVSTIVFSLLGLYWFPNSLIGPMWGRFLSSFVIFLVSIYFFKTEFEISITFSFLRGLFNFCLPVFLFLVLSWVLSYFDRFIIKHFMQSSDVAVYDFIVKCTLILDFVLNGLSSAITPKVFNLFKEKNLKESTIEMNRYFNGFIFITLLMVPFLVFVIPVVIPFIVTKHAYYTGFPYVEILCLGFLARGLYLMYMTPIYYFKKTHVLPLVLLATAIIQVSLSIFGVNYYGLEGAVWANFLSRPLQVVFLFLASRKIFAFRFNMVKQLYLPLFYTGICIFSYFTFHAHHLILVNLTQMLIIYVAVILVFRNEIPVILEQFNILQYIPFRTSPVKK
jgi:O-antigen/teichoic acid export membrane protein